MTDTATQALDFLLAKYTPGTPDDADEFLSTAVIAAAIENHTGSRVLPSEVHAVLLQHNYSYEVYKELQFNWLMKKKLKS